MLEPVLRLMQAETRRCVVSAGALACASGFCLEELDLSGNPLLSETFLEATGESLRLLRTVREEPWTAEEASDAIAFEPPLRVAAPVVSPHTSPTQSPSLLIPSTVPPPLPLAGPAGLAPASPTPSSIATRGGSFVEEARDDTPANGETRIGGRVDLRRACSEPPRSRWLPMSYGSPQPLPVYSDTLPARDAMSDIGEVSEEDEDEDDTFRQLGKEPSAFAESSVHRGAAWRISQGATSTRGGTVMATNREAFLLRRAEDRRRFRTAATVLASRRPRLRASTEAAPENPENQNELLKSFVDCCGQNMHTEAELTITGILGPSAAQSLVRQALLAELRPGSECIGGYGELSHFCMNDHQGSTCKGVSQPAGAPHLATRFPGLQACAERSPSSEIGAAMSGEAVSEMLSVFPRQTGPSAGVNDLNSGSMDIDVTAFNGAFLTDDTAFAEEAEAELLRVERLEALRAAVLGVLSSPPSQPPRTGLLAFGGGELGVGSSDDSGGDASKVRVPVDFVNAGASEGLAPTEGRHLDDMRREALDDLCGRLLVREGLQLEKGSTSEGCDRRVAES
eukprot:TRINITY_DN37597_c0_g1_i1.p1 TRINITY_DN37597_c0_g1~~TRINITY_DN37597_c0_g1_i1.p1  ORF type:complete len:635 (+),score=86.63 TRINITY_DN37597_c0_g1_i1:207-1907(+)